MGRYQGCQIAVYGDLVVDEFLFGEISRVSREAPVLILKQKESLVVPGGAANAVNNLCALGACPIPFGIVGDDVSGRELIRQFKQKRIETHFMRKVPGYQTPTKTRVLAGSVHSSRQQVLRLDRGSRFDHQPQSESQLWKEMDRELESCRGVIISDYDFGYVSAAVVAQLGRYRDRLPVVLDSRFQLLKYHGITAATPNEPEVEEALGIKIGNDLSKLDAAGRKLLKRQQFEALLITRGRDGMALFEPHRPTSHLSIFGTDEIADVTGAGDTVIAVFTLSLAVGANFLEAAKLSNFAGGIVVMKRGTATVSVEELEAAVITEFKE
ncbi:MAG TPA: bifunctional ADP-heptose synthase [Terriglobia bacterium]|nr:bifunctional ADP-heptose synthase [Terriglobia bacterium]